MASPYVAAAVTVVWSAFPLANATTIEKALFATAEDLGIPGKDKSYGHGLVNVDAAIAYLLEDDSDGGGDDDSLACTEKEMKFKVHLKTDLYATETSWMLHRKSDGGLHLAGTGFENDQEYHTSNCIPKDCYEFTILDSFGDGMCSGFGDGFYRVIVDDAQIAQGCDFGKKDETTFGDCPKSKSKGSKGSKGKKKKEKQNRNRA